MKEIFVKDYVDMGMTEKQGYIIREEIEKSINTEDYIELNFKDINLFATMFFNAFIGYYAKLFTPDICSEKIRITNISTLGMETYKHSYNNAKIVIENGTVAEKISIITTNSINDA